MASSGNSEAIDGENVLQAYGQAQYAQRNYVGALEAFSTMLTVAMRDADLLVQGYLRTAQVLQLKQRLEDALQLYEYALKTIDANDAKRPKIELLKAKLEKALNPPRQDPFGILPPELVAMVLGHLDLRTLICPKVVDIDLTDHWATLDDYRLLDEFPGLKRLAIRSGYTLGSQGLDALLRVHPVLESLTIQAKDFSIEHIRDKSSPMSQLRSLAISLPGASTSDPIFFDSTLKDRMPVLEELKITGSLTTINFYESDRDISSHPCLRIIKLSQLRLSNHLEALPPALEEIHMAHMTDVTEHWPDHNILRGLPNLRVAVFDNPSNDINSQSLEEYFESVKPNLTLKSLTLTNCRWVNSSALLRFMLADYLDPLTELNIASMCGVEDETIMVMRSAVPKLRKLDLSRTRVTGFSIKLLADEENSKLETLIVHETEDPVSRDAVEYGRSKGIHIPTPICQKY
ncbi:F-box domain-containing protein [Arthroderma uncinatum]|uniref:F-box domain-containing protein n=1 Tax=Arthroderma uncinatum TaxID=74035 RepID=UPI00144A6A92|nr:F-box domain-containing protein [Arthroderma uncinatum]KAF3484171.1 F-box domain-containing protein [Arthroderma uncinatum]